MNITPWTVYLITRADSVQGVAAVGLFVLFMLSMAGVFGWMMLYSEVARDDEPKFNKWFLKTYRWIAIAAAVLTLVKMLTPTTKELAAIIVLPAIVNSKDVQGLGAELPKLAREWLEELRPKSEKPEANK